MSVITANIYLDTTDATNSVYCSVPVYVEMNKKFALYGSSIIRKERERFFPNNTGRINMTLIETDTMSSSIGSTVYYTLTMPSIGFSRDFTVPASTITSNFFDLPIYTE